MDPSRNHRLTLSIIVPVYNEQSTVASVIDQVCGVHLADLDKEIIIADDGSSDDTPAVLEQLQQDHPEIITVHTKYLLVKHKKYQY